MLRFKNILRKLAPLMISMAIAFGFVVVHTLIELDHYEYGPLSKKGLVHLLDLKALDLKFRSQERSGQSPNVAIAAIDEKSVEEFGLWPWNRRVTADFLDAANAAGVKAIGFDVVYSDEDKNSSYKSIKKFLEKYESEGLNADGKAMKSLEAWLSGSEKEQRALERNLNDLRSKIKAAKGPNKAQLTGSLRKLENTASKNQKSIEQGKAALTTLRRKTTAYSAAMTREIDSISPDQELGKAFGRHADKIVQGYFHFTSKVAEVGVDENEAQEGFARIQPSALDTVYVEEYQELGDQEVLITKPVTGYDIGAMEIRESKGVRAPLALFAKNGKHFGYFNVTPDEDGPIRRIRMFHKHKNQLYPALSLQTAALYFDNEVHPLQGTITRVDRTLSGIDSINPEFDDPVPTDFHGRYMINYYTKPENYFPAYSIAEIISGKIGKAELEGKVLFVGMTALGLFDLRPTPFSATTPGVYVHAQAAQNIIDSDYISRDFGAVTILEILAYLLMGLLMGIILPRVPILISLAITAMLVAGIYLVDLYVFFPSGVWVMNVLPSFQALMTFLGISVYGFLTEGREKRKIKNAFQFYLTKSVVDQVLQDPSKLQLGGEKLNCTVLFSDIRGFTTISERLSPEELVALLNEYLTPMTDIVFQYEGTLDKYMGDAVMAIFGAPVNHADHPSRACFASLDMMEALAKLQIGWREQGLPELDIGIGLNTGSMSVGNMGSEIRFDYTVMGDNVNLGARLEGINKQYGTNIIISEYTFEAAKDSISARELDSVRVKGKKEPVVIYELMAKGTPGGELLQTIDAFESGIRLYKAQAWDDAIKVFDRIRTELKEGDFASSMYIQRCEAMRADPPGEDWDGVFTMTTK